MSQIQEVKQVNYLEWHEDIFGIVHNTLRETVYKTMVGPKLEYACEAYGTHTTRKTLRHRQKKSKEKAPDSACRTMLHLPVL